MSLATKYNTELLAPAGSIEAFFAAMEGGADAVYCGLNDFSARAKAKNFSMADMEKLSGYAQNLGRKLYVPLNTLVQEAELPHLIDTLAGLCQCQVSGVIVQDLGIYNLIRNHFPELPLHASTQMAVHNSAGVQMLERMGFERAVLARELTLAEIKEIRLASTIELEHFVHGALCYSISGHCLFSSFLTGNSGNRGGCGQPCRRRYNQHGEDLFAFSTADFSTLTHLPALAKNGVMSFKIEGRMKNSEYVWQVVQGYRRVLDAPDNDIKAAIREGTRILKESHGRQSTAGFLTGQRKAILLTRQKGGLGKTAGQVDRARGKQISFTSCTTLHIGDKLRIQPTTDKPGTSFVIREIQLGKKRVKQAQKGQYITVPCPFHNRFAPQDDIFKIASGRGFTLSEEACKRRLANATLPPTQIDLHISCTTSSLTVTTSSPVTQTRIYEIETFAAQKSPLSRATLESIFGKTGHANLQLGVLKTTDLPAVVIKPSRLKAIRRDFYGSLSTQLHHLKSALSLERSDAVKGILLSDKISKLTDMPRHYVVVDQPGAEQPDPSNLTLILPLSIDLKEQNSDVVWDIPAIIYDGQWQETKAKVAEKRSLGDQNFRLNNIGHLDLFETTADLHLMAGPALYCLNSQAIQALRNLGVQQFTSSMEDDRANITALSQRTSQLITPIYGHITLMTSRIPLASNHLLSNQSGDSFQPIQDNSLTQIESTTPFSLSGQLHELQQTGTNGYLIDLRGHSLQQQQTVLRAIEQDKMIPGSTAFNYNRGLV